MGRFFMVFRLVSLFLLIYLGSCRSIDRIFVGKPLGDYTEIELVEEIINNEIQFNTLFYRRLLANIDHGGQERSVRANMYIKKDQEIVISVIPFMGIEAVRIKFDKVSVQIMDRINREYSVATYQQLSNRFNVPLSYDILERILTNRMFEFPFNQISNIKRYSGDVYDNFYSLKSHDDRTYARMLDTNSYNTYQRIDILPDIYRVLSSFIDQPGNNTSLRIGYADFRSFNGNEVFPYSIRIIGNMGSNSAKLELNLNQVEKNSDASIGFSIPSNYERVNF
ncbi:uncharacterized protein DUF4292 [Natronoflexus pectinivorans]|uniref:Uncharacterized protein DUF4292 n=1 Tax=Natronoflexus pectinivorans TaxID=682526 RepID=A0A4R2GPG4_9BACT|nr:uncharacterized protein DUF4292 [Natronoflexus pectinivorans]